MKEKGNSSTHPRGMPPSDVARVTSASRSGLLKDDLVPRMHMKKDGFKASLMTCKLTADTVRTHLQRCRTLGKGLLKLCAHQSPYTGRTHRLFPSPQAASVHLRFEPTVTPPSRVTSRGCYHVPLRQSTTPQASSSHAYA